MCSESCGCFGGELGFLSESTGLNIKTINLKASLKNITNLIRNYLNIQFGTEDIPFDIIKGIKMYMLLRKMNVGVILM